MTKSGMTGTLVMAVVARAWANTAADAGSFRPFTIPEDQVRVVLYVDGQHARAADTHPGTNPAAPFKTISAAAAVALSNKAQNVGTKILIAPGVYREEVLIELPGYQDGTPPGSLDASAAPLVIEAREKGTVILEGADIWAEGWTREADGRTWSHAWTNKWGVVPDCYGQYGVIYPEICRRREMVWIKGRPLRPVLDKSELMPGTFHVAEEEGKLYLCPPRGGHPRRLRPEVALRSRLFVVSGLRNVVVRGLVAQHAASVQFKHTFAASKMRGVLIEDCDIRWNNWHGFVAWASKDVVLRRVKGNDNGEGNFIGYCVNLLAEDVETSRNNWRGHWGNYHGWSLAGIKVMFNHGLVFRRFRAEDNLTGGLWFDTDNADVLLDDCRIFGGYGGIIFENNQGPIVVSNCVVAGSWSGVVIDKTANGTLTDCVLYDNGVQILLQGPPFWSGKDFETGQEISARCENWTWRNNLIVSTNSGYGFERTQYYWTPVALSPLVSMPLWDHFIATLKSSRNLWWHPRANAAFQVGELGKSRELAAGLGLDEWRMVTGQDLDSVFADPRFVAPEKRDFRFGADSPVWRRAEWPRVTMVELEQRLERMVPEVRRYREAQRELKQAALEPVTNFALAQSARSEAFQPLPLGAGLNRPLTGEDAWIGMPLTQIMPGRHVLRGVPFDVADRAVALRSARLTASGGQPLPGEVVIPVGRKARAVYILHGGGWMAQHEKVAEYALVYQDGTTARLPVVAYGPDASIGATSEMIRNESNIQDWWGKQPQFENERVKPVKLPSPDGTPRYLYVVEWVNPHPEKEIASLRLTGDTQKNAMVLVLAVTLFE